MAPPAKAPSRSPLADRLGILASALCAVHCAAGLLLAGAASVAGLLRDERVELLFLAAALGFVAFALGSGLRRHGRATPVAAALGGLASLACARSLAGLPDVAETALSVLGSAGLISAHLLNLRALRAAAPAAAHDCCASEAPT